MKDLILVFRDLFRYVKEHKKWWLIPALIALFVTGFLIASAGTSPVPVFVYPLA